MREIFDEYCWEKHKKILTSDVHQIPGLRNFAYWNQNHASKPTPLHYHSDIIEIHCLLKGTRETTVDNKHYKIAGNQLFITFPYELHQTSTSAESPCEFYGLQIDLKNRQQLLGLDSQYSSFLADTLSALPKRHLKMDSQGITMLKKAFDCLQSADKIHFYTGVQYLCCFLFELQNLKAVDSAQSCYDTPISRAVTYINENFRQEIRLEQLADISGYSLSRFKIKFKDEVGITPAEFLNQRKIEYAKQQLELTDRSITDIAFDTGFSSSNYFCSVFKKYVFCSPLNYRRKFHPK